MTLPVYNLGTQDGRCAFGERLRRLRYTTAADQQASQDVARIITDVRERGDDAVVQYMRQWVDPDFDTDRIRVAADEIAAARAGLDSDLETAIRMSIEHVHAYHEHVKPADPPPIALDGAELGMRFTPVDSVGLTVPGGTAVLFSTLIMLAVPAQVAGVALDRIAVINPPPTRQAGTPAGDISPIVLAVCDILGVKQVYRIGGAQGVAALALGTQTIDRVDMIAGPGNIYVQLAKAQVAGLVGTDGGFYGPSEITTIADDSANPRNVAADLIAQAEHDPGKCFLIAWSGDVLDAIVRQVGEQVRSRERRGAIEAALCDESCAVQVVDAAQAVEVANTIACEHVNLAVADPDAVLSELRHAGEVFLSDKTPVAAGDYFAGPSHCLPTGSTARFASGVSTYTFLKRTGTVRYREGMSKSTIDAIARLAEAEGLDGHAESVRVRRSQA